MTKAAGVEFLALLTVLVAVPGVVLAAKWLHYSKGEGSLFFLFFCFFVFVFL